MVPKASVDLIYRVTIDLAGLNHHIDGFAFAMPRIDEFIQSTASNG